MREAPAVQQLHGLNVVPLQPLAYFIGVRRGADVDLAKSVTVE